MVQVAERSASRLARPITLTPADAMALPFADERFDSVVCTYSLCGVPDQRTALTEAVRVLQSGGSLLLADHIVASNLLLRALEHLVELVSIPYRVSTTPGAPSTQFGSSVSRLSTRSA